MMASTNIMHDTEQGLGITDVQTMFRNNLIPTTKYLIVA